VRPCSAAFLAAIELLFACRDVCQCRRRIDFERPKREQDRQSSGLIHRLIRMT
jgi:hypothetical protein